MKKVVIALAALVLASCSAQKTTEEEAIRAMCAEMAEKYPQSTLQDVYKSCFQDFFGAEHLLSDTAAAQAVHDYFGLVSIDQEVNP